MDAILYFGNNYFCWVESKYYALSFPKRVFLINFGQKLSYRDFLHDYELKLIKFSDSLNRFEINTFL